MSADTIFIVDTPGVDPRHLSAGSQELERVRSAFLRCLSEAGVQRAKQTAMPVALPLLGFVELDGPWNLVCSLGQGAIAIGTGEKWDVFLADQAHRIACLREVLCLADAWGSTQVSGFSSEGAGGRAREMVQEGGTMDDAVRFLTSGARRFDVTAPDEKTAEAISDWLGALGDLLDEGFFMIDLQRDQVRY